MAILNDEQKMLRDAAKNWAADRAPVSALRKLRESGGWALGHDPAAWREMAEMGWAGVIIPETYGGSDFGYLSLGLVLEECGRHLTASPLHSSALAAASVLILGGSDSQKRDLLPGIAAGEVIATLAVDESAHHRPEQTAMTAVKSASGYVLSGRKRFIPDAGAAHIFVVAARTGGAAGQTAGITLFIVGAKDAGVTVQPLHAVDNRGAGDITFENVAVSAQSVIGTVDNGWEVLSPALDRARAGLAAEMLGTASEAFDVTLEYLKTRTQFGQLIGSFQSLQHRAAKMFTEIELTRSVVEAALEALDKNAPDAAGLASLAKAKANDTLHLVSNEMVQMHGGIGMTDAHDAGLYLKRARVAEALYGSSTYHRDRYATLAKF